MERADGGRKNRTERRVYPLIRGNSFRGTSVDGCGGIRDPWPVGVAIGVTYLCCEPAECGQ